MRAICIHANAASTSATTYQLPEKPFTTIAATAICGMISRRSTRRISAVSTNPRR